MVIPWLKRRKVIENDYIIVLLFAFCSFEFSYYYSYFFLSSLLSKLLHVQKKFRHRDVSILIFKNDHIIHHITQYCFYTTQQQHNNIFSFFVIIDTKSFFLFWLLFIKRKVSTSKNNINSIHHQHSTLNTSRCVVKLFNQQR